MIPLTPHDVEPGNDRARHAAIVTLEAAAQQIRADRADHQAGRWDHATLATLAEWGCTVPPRPPARPSDLAAYDAHLARIDTATARLLAAPSDAAARAGRRQQRATTRRTNQENQR